MIGFYCQTGRTLILWMIWYIRIILVLQQISCYKCLKMYASTLKPKGKYCNEICKRNNVNITVCIYVWYTMFLFFTQFGYASLTYPLPNQLQNPDFALSSSACIILKVSIWNYCTRFTYINIHRVCLPQIPPLWLPMDWRYHMKTINTKRLSDRCQWKSATHLSKWALWHFGTVI